MNLAINQVQKITEIAQSYIGKPYLPNQFECADFVREVYKRIGIEVPLLAKSAPPVEFNITTEQLAEPPIGHLMFLKNPKDRRQRSWTHVVIILSRKTCIHCSFFFGKKVVVSTFEEIFQRYEFAESAAQ